MEEVNFTFAEMRDQQNIKDLLSACNLPYEDIANHLQNFLLAKRGEKLVGVVGLELFHQLALLRSFAVSASERGRGIGNLLLERISAFAHLKGIEQLFILTCTASEYFEKRGFCSIDRKEAPADIQETQEFKMLCPISAVCMMKSINKVAQYYPRELLRLEDDVPGAKMWAVNLENTMLTYFEVEPESRFEHHSHASEQITYVLEGELFFEIEGRISCVRSGEVIAIPSNTPHAVFTQAKAVKAVDAWSPVMGKYRK